MRATIRNIVSPIVFTLPIDLTYQRLVNDIRFAFSRRGLSVTNITIDTPFTLLGPLGLEVLISDDEELLEAMDEFQDAFDGAHATVSSEILKASGITSVRRSEKAILLDIPTDFVIRDIWTELFRESQTIDVELGLW